MQADLDPTVQILPFDNKYAVRAKVLIHPDHQRQYLYRSFLVFVLEVRSAMDESSIGALKKCILDLCFELLERGGIDNIGFVINAQYYTIRNPNYEGIKDLLNANVRIEDSKDIRETLKCLRHSIMNESKKMEGCKLTLFMFSSNVKENPLSPTKQAYRERLNSHLPNYYQEINRLKTTIKSSCVDSRFYTICYANTEGSKTKEEKYGWRYCVLSENSYFDVSFLYSVSNCVNSQKSFNFCQSFTKLNQHFNDVSALILYDFHEFSLMIPVQDGFYSEIVTEEEEKEERGEVEDLEEEQIEQFSQNEVKFAKIKVTNTSQAQFQSAGFSFYNKQQLNLEHLHSKGYHIVKDVFKNAPKQFPKKKKLIKYIKSHFKPSHTSTVVDYHEPSDQERIQCVVSCYKDQLKSIMSQLQNDILKYKRKFNKETRQYEYYNEVDDYLQFKLRQRVEAIEKSAREVYESVFKSKEIRNQNQKRKMFELYSSLKSMLDVANETLMKTLKKQIQSNDIGTLSKAINYDKIKSSLKRKLIKRVNSNPKLIDQTYDRIDAISQQLPNLVDLEAKHRFEKSEVGNCMYTFRNFATSLRQKDCLALVFQMERPDSAIADPGRIRIRQVSTMVASVSKFFQIHLYKVPTTFQITLEEYDKELSQAFSEWKQNKYYCPICEGTCLINVFTKLSERIDFEKNMPDEREVKEKRKQYQFGLSPKGYKERWDYWNRVQNTKSFFGLMPLYVCEENWKVAKLLMKPCMGWNACGEPLGYTYSQTQTIPFMVLSSLIRMAQESVYKIEELEKQAFNAYKDQDHFEFKHQVNLEKHNLSRFEDLIKQCEATCMAIMRDMSQPTLEEPLDKKVISRYKDYEKPINRTVDVINNNSCLMGQFYTLIRSGAIEKPMEVEFHEFFKRLVEEELRRQTDSWNDFQLYVNKTMSEQEMEESFVNKLLNAHIEQMDKPQYVVLESRYRDNFEKALMGQEVLKTEFQIQRQNLEMMLKEGNEFNPTQRMLLIQYKRLYENRVLWLWYIRFRLYGVKERISIHKWKCLDLKNSYQLFTMIIQNKKQRKNWKRRQAIMQGLYADPFSYEQARAYLEQEYVRMRNKKEAQNIVMLNTEKHTKAATVFSMSPDLDEAAGALMNVELGNEIKTFYYELKRQSRFLEEKLKMLLLGEHKGVPLMKQGWLMSRKRMNKLRRQYPLIFMRYQYMF